MAITFGQASKMTIDKEKDRIRLVSDLLYRATQSVRILSHISWSNEVRERFFASGARELPTVDYAPFDPLPTLEAVQQARRQIKSSLIDEWFSRQADIIENSARLLSACGTPDFFRYSSELYGKPRDVLQDESSSSLALAQQFSSTLDTLAVIDLGAPPPTCNLAQTVAGHMERAVKTMFGEQAPEVLVVDELSSNALAGPRRIRIRRTACFTDRDINQLIEHEAHIHVATSLNGLAQKDLKILGASHAGTTKTQEGLAVFAEFITGSMDLDRMRRLADRVIAVQMAIDGADFIEVYNYFLERTGSQEQGFENARRVFRGGTPGGGAPFTKDIVYLDGLLRVHNFLRIIVSSGRADCLRLLFCGKLDIEDVPVLYKLSKMGLCHPPRYLPPWAADLRFLLCQLAYSSFLNTVDLSRLRSHYDALLSDVPKSEKFLS
jgi:uncharacterized protein (TIGR02421 family)